MGITFSRLRVAELGGIGMLAERDGREDMVKKSRKAGGAIWILF